MKLLKYVVMCSLIASMLISCSFKNNDNTSNNSITNEIEFITANADYIKNGVVFGNDIAMFLDFDTMEKAPLCAVPNCTHTTSSCFANIVGNKPVFYNEEMYYFSSNYGAIEETNDGPEFHIDSYLSKASIESSQTEKVCEFHDCAPVEEIGNYVLYGSELYFIGDDLNPTPSPYGGFGWGNTGGTHFLCSINLDTEKYYNLGSIYDGDKEYEAAAYSSCANIIGVYNNKMYIRYSFCKDNEALQNGIIDFTHIIFEYDFESKKWIETDLPLAIYINNTSYVYYDDIQKKIGIIKSNDKIEIPYEKKLMKCSVLNDKLFIPDDGIWYDLQDLSKHSMGEYKGYDVIAYYDECFILLHGGLNAKITEEELKLL